MQHTWCTSCMTSDPFPTSWLSQATPSATSRTTRSPTAQGIRAITPSFDGSAQGRHGQSESIPRPRVVFWMTKTLCLLWLVFLLRDLVCRRRPEAACMTLCHTCTYRTQEPPIDKHAELVLRLAPPDLHRCVRRRWPPVVCLSRCTRAQGTITRGQGTRTDSSSRVGQSTRNVEMPCTTDSVAAQAFYEEHSHGTLGCKEDHLNEQREHLPHVRRLASSLNVSRPSNAGPSAIVPRCLDLRVFSGSLADVFFPIKLKFARTLAENIYAGTKKRRIA